MLRLHLREVVPCRHLVLFLLLLEHHCLHAKVDCIGALHQCPAIRAHVPAYLVTSRRTLELVGGVNLLLGRWWHLIGAIEGLELPAEAMLAARGRLVAVAGDLSQRQVLLFGLLELGRIDL